MKFYLIYKEKSGYEVALPSKVARGGQRQGKEKNKYTVILKSDLMTQNNN